MQTFEFNSLSNLFSEEGISSPSGLHLKADFDGNLAKLTIERQVVTLVGDTFEVDYMTRVEEWKSASQVMARADAMMGRVS